ncbi:MAG: SphA family protein [Panacagrimonas sp.]
MNLASLHARSQKRPGVFARAVCGLSFLVGSALAPSVTLASESGGFGPFAVGAQTLGSGVLAPPGVTVNYAYLLYYTADKFVGNDGKTFAPLADFKLDAYAEATMTRHTWQFTAGGFNFGSAIIQEAIHLEVEVAGQKDSSSGAVLVNLVPLIVGRHMGNWHALAAGHFIMPGNYDKDALANGTQNYFTFTQELSVTWTPTPQWMIDLSTNYSWNHRNHQTDYESGDLYGLTWGANYRPIASDPRWQVGLHGLYLKQVEDDRIGNDSVPLPGGFRLRKMNAGPQFGYWFNPGAAVVFKWTKEWDTRNGPEGDLFWLQAAFPI